MTEVLKRQKKIEAKLHECLGNDWMPLYSMVTFSHTPYSEAIAMGKQQDEIMKEVLRMERVKDWEDPSVFNEILSIVEQRLSISPSTK